MVAHSRQRLPSTDLDPSECVQGDVGSSIHQVFDIRYTQLVVDPKSKRTMREWHVTDQFENHYLSFRCVLSDGNDYDLFARIKDSELKRYGGFTDELMDAARKKAFHSFKINDDQVRAAYAKVMHIVTAQ